MSLLIHNYQTPWSSISFARSISYVLPIFKFKQRMNPIWGMSCHDDLMIMMMSWWSECLCVWPCIAWKCGFEKKPRTPTMVSSKNKVVPRGHLQLRKKKETSNAALCRSLYFGSSAGVKVRVELTQKQLAQVGLHAHKNGYKWRARNRWRLYFSLFLRSDETLALIEKESQKEDSTLAPIGQPSTQSHDRWSVWEEKSSDETQVQSRLETRPANGMNARRHLSMRSLAGEALEDREE